MNVRFWTRYRALSEPSFGIFRFILSDFKVRLPWIVKQLFMSQLPRMARQVRAVNLNLMRICDVGLTLGFHAQPQSSIDGVMYT